MREEWWYWRWWWWGLNGRLCFGGGTGSSLLAGFVDAGVWTCCTTRAAREFEKAVRSEECLVWRVASERKCGQREWVLGSGGGS